MNTISLIVWAALLFPALGFALKTANTSGNWNVSGTWGGTGVPSASDDIVINTGITVTLVADVSTSGTMTLNGTGTIQMAGFNLTSGTLAATGAAVINNGGAAKTFTTGNGTSTSYTGVLTGAIAFTKQGTGQQTLSGTNTFTGAVSVLAGQLTFTNFGSLAGGASKVSLNTSTGATVEINTTTADVRIGSTDAAGTVISGTGTLLKSGTGVLMLGDQGSTSYKVYMNMTGGTIDVQGGYIRNGGWQGGQWTNNKASLNIASGAYFDLWDGNAVSVDALTGAGDVVQNFDASTRTLNIGVNGGTGDFSGGISNTLAIVKQGAGTQTLSGTPTYSISTTISAGTLQIGNGGTTGTLPTAVTNNGALIFNRSNAYTYGSIISGSGTVTKSGAGTLTFSADNSYTGATTVSTGTLVLQGTYGGTAFSIASGAVLELNRATDVDYAVAATFSGAGTLRKTGTGLAKWGASVATFSLSAGSLIDLQAGSIGVGFANDVWTNNYSGLTVAAGAIFYGAEANVRVDALNGAGTIRTGYSGAGYANMTIGVNNGTGTFSGTIINDVAAGYLVKTGSGAQTLSGANTFSGGYTHTAGITNIGHNTALGSGTAIMNGTGQYILADLINVANALTINANDPGVGLGTVQGPGGTGTGTWSGAITINNSNASGGHFHGGNTTNGLVLTGGITSSAPVVFRANRVTISGSSSYTACSIGGSVFLGATNAIPTGANVTVGVSSAGILDLNGFNQTITDLGKGGSTATVTNSSGTLGTLTLNYSGTDDSTATILTGNLALAKTGAGIFRLRGANTYTGATTITAGTLGVTSSGSITQTQSLILSSGGNMSISGSVATSSDATGVFGVGYGATGTSTLTLNSGGSLSVGNGGGRTFVGGGPSGGPYGTGVLNLEGGTLTVAAAGAFPNDNFYLGGYGGTGTFNLDGGVFITPRTVDKGSGSGSFYFNGGTFRTGSTTWHLTNVTTVQVRDGGAIFDPNGFTLGMRGTLVHSTVGGDNATDGGVQVTGTTGTVWLDKTGDAYTGPTTIASGTTLGLTTAGVIPDGSAVTANGTLDLRGVNETIGSLAGSGFVDNSTGAGTYTLTLGGDNTGPTFSGIIRNTTGTVAVAKAGLGTEVFSGANTYTGGTTVNGGGLRVDNNSGFGTGTVTVNAGGFALIWASSAKTLANNFALNGSSGNSSYPTLCHDGGAGAVVLNGNISLTASSEIGMGGTTSNNMTLNGVISGTGALTVDEANGGSANTLKFAGASANTYSGGTIVNGGTLLLAKTAGVNAIPGDITIGDGSGNDQVTLGADNQIADAAVITFVSGGVGNSAKFMLDGYNETVAGIQSNANQASVIQNTESGAPTGAASPALLTINNTADYIYDGLIRNTSSGSGTLALTKTGAGTLTVRTGFNPVNINYSGATTISAGKLVLENLTVQNSAITNNSAAADALTFTCGTNNLTTSQVISGSGALTKEGTGTLTLSGTNTFTGATTINAGTLKMGAAAALGTTAAGTTITSGATLDLNGQAVGAEAMTPAGTGVSALGAIINSSGSAASWSGGVNVAAGATLGGSGDITLSGQATAGTLTKIGSCTLTISGTGDNGSFGVTANAGTVLLAKTSTSGVHAIGGPGLTVGGGTVKLGGSGGDQIYDPSGITVNSGTFDLNGNSEGFSNFTGAGTVDNTAGAGTFTLTVGISNTSSTFSGIIQNTSQTLALTKSGTGTLTLSGANTYSGLTTISAGGIKLGSTTALGAVTNGTSITSGAVLDLNGITYASAEPLTINGTGVTSGGAVKNGSATAATFPGLLTLGSASSIIAGSGNITLSNAGTITGATFDLTLGGAANGTLTSIVGTTSGKIVKQDAGTWTLGGANTYTGGTDLGAGTLSVSAANNLGAPSGVIGANFTGDAILAVTSSFSFGKEIVANGASRSITINVAASQTFTSTAALRCYTGAGFVNKTGTGTWIQAGDGGYVDGSFNLQAGTLEFQVADGWGDNSGDVLHLSAGTTLRLVGDAGVSFVGNLDVAGAGVNLIVNRSTGGAGVTQSFNNLTTTGAYTLAVSAGSNVTSGTAGFGARGTTTLGGNTIIDVTNPAGATLLTTLTGAVSGATYNLTVQGTGNTAIAGAIGTTSGSVTKTGAGALSLSGNNTFTGGVTLTTGTLNINSATALGTVAGTLVIANGTTLDNTSGGSITLTANNPQTWNGDFTFTGSNALNMGTGAVAMGASLRTVTTTASTLTVGGIISGTAGLTKAGTGTLAFGASSGAQWTGTTTVNAGTMQLGSPGGDNYVSTAWVVNNTGTLLSTSPNVIINSAVITVNTGGTWNLGGGYDAIGYVAGAGSITNTTLSGLTLDTPPTGAGSDFSGVISGTGGIYIRAAGGTGTQIFSGLNTYTGVTVIQNGTLSVNTIGNVSGGASSLGAPTSVANGTIAIGSTTTTGTLLYTGTGSTSDRVLDLAGTTGGAIIDQSGTGLLKFTSAMTATGAGAKTLTLQGSTAGTGEIAGAIVNSSSATTVTKAGSGTWTLSGANTYDGVTTVSAGILKLGSTTALGTVTGATSVTAGAALDLNGVTYASAEGLTLNSTGISSGGALLNSSATGATFPGLITLGSATSILGGTGTIALTNVGTITGATFGLTLGGAQGGTLASILGTTTGTLTKQDAGTWTLSGASTLTGGSSVTGGTLCMKNTSALGTGSTYLGGTLQVLIDGAGNNGTISMSNPLWQVSSSNGTLNVGNNGSNTGNTVQFPSASCGNATINVTGANGYKAGITAFSMNGGAGTTTFNPTTADLILGTIASNGNGAHILQLDGTSTGSAVTGVISVPLSALSLSKTNSSNWTLGGTNAYTGTTTVSAGTLTVTGSLNASSAVTVASGATLAGTGTVAGTTTISAGGIVSPGNANEATLSTGPQVLNNTSVLTYTLGATSDKVAVTGNLTLDGTINVTAGTGFRFGTYTLMTYSGSLTNNTLNVGTLPAGYFGTITAGSGVVTLSLLDYTGWNYVSTINFNTTSTGANVPGNVTNFPMLVRLDSNNFMFDQAMPDGRDIRFADPDGTALPYEIERWDATLKKAEIWVLVPQVDGNSDRDFMNMYWGNASATSQSGSAGVFASTSGFGGVWHLNAAFADASSNSNNGANTNSTDTAGIIGRARWFATGSSQYVEMPYSSTLNLSSFTFSAWTKVQTLGSSLGIISSRFGSDNTFDAQWTTTGMHGDIGNGTSWLTASADYVTAPASGVWNYVTWTATTNAYNVYLNGVLVTPGVIAGTPQFMKSGETLRIGQTTASGYFSGAIDEPRVDNVVRSADWIKLSYATQMANSTALVYPNSALSTFAYSNKIYVNTSATGANTATDVTNFPLLVRLTAANFNFSQAKSDGSDLRFADSTGALLPYELGRFDVTNKLAEAWVLLPTVKANNNSQWFKMYWGKPSATSLSSANAVWQNSNGHVGDYHLNEASGTVYDATPNANNGTFNGNVPNQQNGIIGKAHLFDGNGDYIDMGTNSTLDFSANDRITVSAWVNRSGAAVAGPDEGIVSKIEWSASNDRSWNLVHKNSSLGFRFGVSTDGTSGNETIVSSNYQATNATWYHVVGVADGTKVRIYVNGVERGNSAFSGNIFYSTNSTLKIGENDDDGASNRQYWNGYIDEVNVSNVARSADWIKLAYETQKAAATAVSLGSRPLDFTNSIRLNFNTTATGANVTGTDVTNIPILVRLTSANFDFTKVTATGTDIQFIDKDGTYLYHEVVEWDKGNSTGKVWVKVPQVDKNSTTDYITLYYGCAACTASPYALSDSVWSGYAGVYHLNAPQNRAYDATKNAYHGNYTNDQPSGSGITTNLAPSFDGLSDYISTTLPTNVGTRTLEAWIRPRSSDDVAFMETVIDGDVGGQFGNGFGLDNGRITVILDDQWWGTNQAVTLNAWQQVAVKFNATNVVLYYNGLPKDSTTYTQGGISSTTYKIGKSNANALYFDGFLNDVKIADVYQSADFIKLSYENQKATSTLFSTTTITSASFQHSKVFKFNTTASGANIPGDVYNFPVLIRLTGATVINATQANAPDIRFLDGDGVTWLDYEIERWNQSIDSAEVWVKVPKVEGNTSGDFITMYYQQASGVTVPDGQCASCVFGTDNNYVGVWHLNTSGTGARPNAVSGGNSLTTSGYEGDEYMIGDIANCDNLEGTNDYLNMGSGYADFTSGLTYSIWAYPTASGSWARFFDVGNGTGTDNINFARSGTSSDLVFENYNNTTSGGQIAATGVITNNTWQHFVVTMDPQLNVKIYKNGALVKTGVSTNAIRNVTRTSAFIGKSNWADAYYAGRIDEPEISKVARDSNWIKLAYQNQRTDATPLFNPNPTDFQKSKKYTFNTTRTGANVSGDVANFPMLVRFTDADGGLLSLVQSGAPDIRFLDGDGKTWLNYQIERWSTATSPDSAEIWVNVPKVDGNSDHDFITMYYQQAAGVTVADGQCGACVFDTTNGVEAAWHLNNALTDATINANAGTNQGSVDGEGVVSSGRSFSGTAQYATFGNANSLKNIANDITVEAWIKTSLSASSSPISVLRYDGKYTALQYSNGSNTTRTAIWHPGLGLIGYTWNGQFDDNSWHHFVSQYDATLGLKLYRDGILYGSTNAVTGALPTTNTNNFAMGGTEAGAELWTGKLDEVRVYRSLQDSNWIKLDYETQRRSGNLFWNSRPSPDNTATLTATATPATSTAAGYISLAWNSAVSDSANADSVGIWVRYAGYPDSVGSSAVPASHVVTLAKTDTTYSYPATYPGTYYFALAVRNINGVWSPYTKASSDTANQNGNAFMIDTVYVDSAIGSNANSCVQARNPATPMLTITNALTCGGNANDTLVVRVLPGTYAADNSFSVTASKPSVVQSFDPNSHAVLNGTGTLFENVYTINHTIALNSNMTLRQMDVKSGYNGTNGSVHIRYNAANITVDGCRIFGGSNTQANAVFSNAGISNILIANNLIYKPTANGIYTMSIDGVNILNNTFVGSTGINSVGIRQTGTAGSTGSITNNIFDNWDWGIYSSDADLDIGLVSNNLFNRVTTGQEIHAETDANRIIKSPLFADTLWNSKGFYKLLPGSPAIDAGTSSLVGGGYAGVATTDYFGSARTVGTAKDIGYYEGTGYTPNPAGDFDTLTTTSTATTVTVYNSKWKIVFDKAKGGGISEFYDQSAPATNLLAAGTVLFDAKVDALVASSQSTIAPTIIEQCASRVVVWQRYGASGSLDVNLYYTIHPSGHIYIQSQLVNLSGGTLTVGTVDYTAKVNSATAAFTTAAKDGFGYLTTTTRDVAIVATQALDNGSSAGSETWTGSATSGASGKVVFNTTDLLDIVKNFRRNHHFLLYIGDASLTYDKTAALNSDVSFPSSLTTSAGGLIHERSWQDMLAGHWTFDEGAGSIVRDKSITNTNNGTITGAKFASGKVGGGLTFANTDVVVVNDDNALEASNSRTFMFWVKPTWASCGSTAFIISKGQTTSDGWYFRRNSGASTMEFRVAGTTISTPALTTGVWSHIAGTIGNTDKVLRLYVNGVLEAASTSACTPTANASNLRFGENTGGGAADKYVGALDDVRIYNTDLDISDIQSVYNQGFSQRYGHYRLRADNNNRLVALINGGAAVTRIQPSFQIDNWYGPATPKYVYLNGVRLKPLTDFSSSILQAYNPEVNSGIYGYHLILQLNKVLTGADQTLFIDDDDSTGYMGTASQMKSLTMSSVASDKIVIKNFSDTVFSGATSGQWYTELDLDGGTSWSSADATSKGFGEFNVWKAAAVNPNVAISSGTNLATSDGTSGTSIMHMKFSDAGAKLFTAGAGHLAPTTYTYTLTDSSATRMSFTLSATSLKNASGTATLVKRWTIYPTGRIFGSYALTASTFALDEIRLDFQETNSGTPATSYTNGAALINGRNGLQGGDLGFHSLAGTVLSLKANASTTTAPATNLATVTSDINVGSYSRLKFNLKPALFTTTNVPYTINFTMDISKDFTDSLVADSLMKDLQTPAAITAISGTAVTNDALDFNGDGFAEGDGAYTYAAAGTGVAHFKFANTVTTFNPAFRISSWTFGTLPEYIIVDNQTYTKGYHYNAFLNTATNELILQFNKTFAPGTHVFYISHKNGLAVTLRSFVAKGGEGVDTLEWSTESEFENLGYNLYRRVAAAEGQLDSNMAVGAKVGGAGIANAILDAARAQVAAKAAAKLAKAQEKANAHASGDSASASTALSNDTLPSMVLTPEELAALGYERITARLIPGAPGGASATTQQYKFLDRTAAFGIAYEYLLESVDFGGSRQQFGPRIAKPTNPLLTELYPNYPNPFNPITTLHFSLKDKAVVSLIIYDGKGKVVRTLLRPDKPMAPGKYRLIWDAKNEAGIGVPSGQYFYRLTAPHYNKTRKMILVK